jgi:hypothetical protein
MEPSTEATTDERAAPRGTSVEPTEVRLPARPRPDAHLRILLGALALGCAACAVVEPRIALAWVLPFAAVIAVFWVGRASLPRVSSVVVSAPGLRTTEPGRETFVPWTEVRRLLDRPKGSGMVAELRHGGTIELDLAGQPDVRPILALVPHDVEYVRLESSPAPSPRRALLLWFLLICAMTAIWRLVDR